MNTLVSLFFSILLAFSGFTRPQTIHFDEPNTRVVLEPGSTCSISWHLDPSGPHQYTHVDLFLMQFLFGRFFIIEPIAYDVDVNTTGPIEWDIPQEDILEGLYVIGAVARDCNYRSFSDYFWILRDYYYSPPSRSISDSEN